MTWRHLVVMRCSCFATKKNPRSCNMTPRDLGVGLGDWMSEVYSFFFGLADEQSVNKKEKNK